MPWTADEMKKKGCSGDAAKAAEIANSVLKKYGDEGMAIRIALAYTNRKGKDK